MKQLFALWLSVMVIAWSVILPTIAIVVGLVLFNVSAGLSIGILVMLGFPIIMACGLASHKIADRISDWGDENAR
jgi:hypothetical protein